MHAGIQPSYNLASEPDKTKISNFLLKKPRRTHNVKATFGKSLGREDSQRSIYNITEGYTLHNKDKPATYFDANPSLASLM
jgi:hypothetical protein